MPPATAPRDHEAPLFRTGDDAPTASVRRGVCPSLSRPMVTGDGLLVRLRPASGGLTPRELVSIAEAAARFGNGILEVTARGNLQIRGLKAETVEPLTQAVFATGIDLATGLAVETPPLSGLDPAEVADGRPLAARIRARVAGHVPALALAAKLSVIVDGGGTFCLDPIVADLRLKARKAEGGVLWALSFGGTEKTARFAALLDEAEALKAVMQALETLDRAGPSARGRDLDPAALGFPGADPHAPPDVSQIAPAIRRPAGLHRLEGGLTVAGVGLAFCQVKAAVLVAFAEKAEQLGIRVILLAPEHGLLAPGLGPDDAAALLGHAAKLGFRVTPDDPANAMALCAGTAGCASAFYDTHGLAELIIERAPDLLDGSFDMHLSGCAKGCAHPAAALLTLAGAPLGYGLVVNGSASHSPAAYIAANDVASAVERLAALVRTEKEDGEPSRACLERLGAERIATALQRE